MSLGTAHEEFEMHEEMVGTKCDKIRMQEFLMHSIEKYKEKNKTDLPEIIFVDNELMAVRGERVFDEIKSEVFKNESMETNRSSCLETGKNRR